MRRWILNVALAVDQLGNAIAAGNPDETISSRLGRWKLRRMRAGAWPPAWWHPAYWLERALDRIDPDHVLDAIEPGMAEDAVVWRVSVPR